MTWQLVAHPESAVCDILSIAVNKALGRPGRLASVARALNVQEATDSVTANGEDDLDLVVIASTLPPDNATGAGSKGREPTKTFIRDLKRNRFDLPIVVVSSTPDDHLAAFLDAFDRTTIVTMGNGFMTSLVSRLPLLCDVPIAPRKPSRMQRAPIAEEPCVQLDIHLGGDQFGFWKMRRTGDGECEASGMLQLDSKLMRTVVRHSQRLNERVAGESGEWLEDLDELSDELRLLLFRNADKNIDCWDRFIVQRTQVGGVSRSRIRITVNDETHSMLVEALRDSGEAIGDSWVLNAPVFRRYATQLAFPPLLKDEASRSGPINALIIEADERPGTVSIAGEREEFGRLRHLKAEANLIYGILRQSAGGTVEHLRLGDFPDDLPARVLAKLSERHWHVVHFCGHVGGQRSGAAIVLRATPEGLLPVKALSKAMYRTQLLFLNSCRSAASRIVMHAVEQSVAAVLGFQWVIEDRAALEFAADFYVALFDRSSAKSRDLENALLFARKKAYTRQPEHPSWIAPVLVMQMG